MVPTNPSPPGADDNVEGPEAVKDGDLIPPECFTGDVPEILEVSSLDEDMGDGSGRAWYGTTCLDTGTDEDAPAARRLVGGACDPELSPLDSGLVMRCSESDRNGENP